MDPVQEVRIDKWLWAVRLYKTRALAAEACRGGHVRVGGQHVKASRLVRVSELISARTADDVTRTVKVTALLENRVGPKLVQNFLDDLTPASEYLRALQVKQSLNVPQRPKGSGRPTKKERRELEKIE